MIGPMPETRVPFGPSRRSVLAVLGLGAAGAALSGCGIRLEDDAPRVPLVPTREPVPGEAFLLQLWLGSQDLAAQASALGGPGTALPARLAVLHRTQAEVLRTLLRTEGVPDSAVADARERHTATPSTAPSSTSAASSAASPTSTPGGPTTGSGTTTAPSRSTLATAEAAALSPESFAALGALDAESVATPAAALAQRAAAATLLGRVPAWPTQEEVPAELAAGALEATRAAVYGFEVVAAQSAGAQRTQATATLATLRARVARLEQPAGDKAPPASLGYPLPFPVTTPGAARRLALHVLEGLRASHAAATGRAARDATGLAATVQWLAEAEGLCHRWGMSLQPFPGLE
jgi:hypothetical protein